MVTEPAQPPAQARHINELGDDLLARIFLKCVDAATHDDHGSASPRPAASEAAIEPEVAAADADARRGGSAARWLPAPGLDDWFLEGVLGSKPPMPKWERELRQLSLLAQVCHRWRDVLRSPAAGGAHLWDMLWIDLNAHVLTPRQAQPPQAHGAKASLPVGSPDSVLADRATYNLRDGRAGAERRSGEGPAQRWLQTYQRAVRVLSIDLDWRKEDVTEMEVLFGNILATVQGEVVRLTVGDQEKYDDPFKQTPDDEEGFCCNLSQGVVERIGRNACLQTRLRELTLCYTRNELYHDKFEPLQIEALAQLSKLEVLRCNALWAAPRWCIAPPGPAFAQLRHSLRVLDLSGNESLRHIPPCVFELRRLEELVLHDCGLVAVPGAIASLQRLVDLDLSDNEGLCARGAIAPEIGALSKLKSLNLSAGCAAITSPRRLSEFPPDIVGLQSLTCLAVHNVRLPLAFFAAVSSLQRLADLDFEGSSLPRLPVPELAPLAASLRCLALRGCFRLQLRAPSLASLLQALPQLQVLYIARGYDGWADRASAAAIREAQAYLRAARRDGSCELIHIGAPTIEEAALEWEAQPAEIEMEMEQEEEVAHVAR